MSHETIDNGDMESAPPPSVSTATRVTPDAGTPATSVAPDAGTPATAHPDPQRRRARSRPRATRQGRYADDSESITKRMVRYEFAVQRCAYVGAGYGGVFLLAGLGGDRVLGRTWWWFQPVLASAITLGVVLLGLAYLRFGWSLRDLRLKDEEPAGKYPKSAHNMYVASVVLLIVAAAAVLTATWIVLSVNETPVAPIATRSP